MSASKNDPFSENDSPQDRQSHSADFSAPLGSLRSGRLVLVSGTGRLNLEADPAMPDLYQARFKRSVPRLGVLGNVVTIEYRRFPFRDQPVNLRGPAAEIRLNSSIPWEIEFRNGVSHLDADLLQLQMRSLDILGGASQIRLLLSKPSGTTFIYISGGISQSMISVPAMTGIRVQISGGSTHLMFGDQFLDAMGGESSLESPDFESAAGRYDICIAGGASSLAIDRQG